MLVVIAVVVVVHLSRHFRRPLGLERRAWKGERGGQEGAAVAAAGAFLDGDSRMMTIVLWGHLAGAMTVGVNDQRGMAFVVCVLLLCPRLSLNRDACYT